MSAADWSELDGYEALVSELRANPPVAPERLRARVLEGAPAPRRQRSRKRRLALVVVPAAVVLAVGAALVHGFVSTGSHGRAASLAPTLHTNEHLLGPAKRAPGQTSTTPEAAAAHKGAVPSWNAATQAQSGKKYLLDQSAAVASGSNVYAPVTHGRAVAIPKNRLVHAVASLQVGVKSSNLSDKTNEASQIVGSFGGYAQSVRYQNSRNGYGEAVLQLRVPVQKAQAAIAKLSTLGTLLSQSVSTQDLQAKLSQQNSGIGSLRRAINVYVQALDSGTLSATERVTIQIRLNNARHALAQLRHARNGTLEAGATADISLLLTTRNHAVVGHHHHKSGRFDRFLGSAGGFLALEGIIVLYALVVLSPILLLGALAWWILRERRRREERLLASA
jgi:hypothetical protein